MTPCFSGNKEALSAPKEEEVYEGTLIKDRDNKRRKVSVTGGWLKTDILPHHNTSNGLPW